MFCSPRCVCSSASFKAVFSMLHWCAKTLARWRKLTHALELGTLKGSSSNPENEKMKLQMNQAPFSSSRARSSVPSSLKDPMPMGQVKKGIGLRPNGSGAGFMG